MRILINIPCLLFVHFFSIFLWVDVVSGSGQGLKDQKTVLLKLKESLTFDISVSQKLAKWDTSLDCCSWQGIGCENDRIVDLDLSREWISDGINNSSSLFQLLHLKRLNLGSNSLNSVEIPSRIGEFDNLTHLNLSNAGFSGQIPIGIACLRRLINLDISNYYYYVLGTKPLKLEKPNLRTLVQDLSGLEELHLDGVNIATGGDDWCSAISTSLPNLRVLGLSYCNLRGPIDSSLANLQLLSDVRLDGNYLSTEVPSFFANFINLTTLSLSSSGLYGRFPEEIFQVPSLKAIDLTKNKLLQGILPELPQNSSLESLVLTGTNFSGELPYSIGNLKFLSWIDLMGCSFSGFLPSSVSNLTQLVYVDMSSNTFTGPIPSLINAKSLSQLYLAHNLFNGSITSTIWNALSQLYVLDLRNNSLSGTIPSSLFTASSLQKLKLSNNHFEKLTILNVSCSVLVTLDLSYNSLDCSFPIPFFEFPNLKVLMLTSNKFTGKIEIGMIRHMKYLSTLDLSYNSLWIDTYGSNASPSMLDKLTTLNLASCGLGKFPDFLKNLSMLTHLDLSMNQIPGKIPDWIWRISTLTSLNLSNNHLEDFEKPVVNITSLVILDLHSNKIHGELPLPPSATYLDFSMNSFGSAIPSNIGSVLSFCYFFSLSSNNFNGTIPESICCATYLQVLDLSSNSLSGTIPECLINFGESLVVMNLQMNSLNGSISDTFSAGCGLKTLDLKQNQLSGPVPKSLAQCRELEVLNLSHNRLSDTFPCSLMNVSSLRVLVLRSNNFHGELGCQGVKEIWNRLQIVDLASNNFSGKLHAQSFLAWKAMIASSDESEWIHMRSKVLAFSNLYYQDAVKVTIKGSETELVKFLTVFTFMDFSNNNFEGNIPGTIGELTSLLVLNFSHNAFTGGIPTSMRSLTQLESLDLSYNNLTGVIPQGLLALTFLSVLNLSFNHLEGPIPIGNQFNTFCRDSFLGNKGLLGPQVKRKCKDVDKVASSSGDKPTEPEKGEENWGLFSAEVGFTVGLGIVTCSLIFWKRWREWYFHRVDGVLLKILNQLRR